MADVPRRTSLDQPAEFRFVICEFLSSCALTLAEGLVRHKPRVNRFFVLQCSDLQR